MACALVCEREVEVRAMEALHTKTQPRTQDAQASTDSRGPSQKMERTVVISCWFSKISKKTTPDPSKTHKHKESSSPIPRLGRVFSFFFTKRRCFLSFFLSFTNSREGRDSNDSQSESDALLTG